MGAAEALQFYGLVLCIKLLMIKGIWEFTQFLARRKSHG